VPVDPALNAGNGWTVEIAADRIAVQVGRRVTFRRADQTLRTIDVLPGSHAVALDVVVEEREIGGRLETVSTASNEVVFAIGPRIVGHTTDAANDRVTIATAAAFALDHHAGQNDELDVQVAIDGQPYRRVASFGPAPADNRGRFTVGPSAVTLAPLFSLTAPGVHAVRLTVEGADAQPYWIELP
jgi:hypothetical protein